MTDLAQALSEIKSLPDSALQKELASPSGMVPGYLVLGEMHERKRLRAGSGAQAPTKRPSMAEEYMGNAQRAFAGAGLAGQTRPPEPPPQAPNWVGSLPPQGALPSDAGISSLPQAPPQGYARGGIVTLGNYRSAGVDPRLRSILERAAASSPYEVRLISGMREGDPRQHGRGTATDVQLYDPETGEILDNYQSGKHFSQYQQYANAARRAQMEMYPELADKFRWGGYFSGGKGKYGALDLMHYDVGGGQMLGGSWEQGLTPQQAALYGITQNAGLSGGGGQNVMVGSAGGDRMSIEQYIRARAPLYGVDPNVAVRVATSEGGLSNIVRQSDVMKGGVREQSYGPFQLYMGGGLGNRALEAGIDPRTEAGGWKGIDFALAEAGNKGWGQWYGAKRVGIDTMQGISGQGSRVPIYDQMTAAAQGTAAASGTVAATAADTAGKMAAAEGDDPFTSLMLMQQMFGGGQQQAAPPPAPVARPQQQFDPSQFYRRGVYG